MRFTRLVIEADHHTVSLVLHPRLTVVAGVDERVRAGLTQELIGGLGPRRSGVHLEVVDDAERHLAVFRPSGGAHRVLDVAEGCDVTDEFRDDEDRVDLLAHYGLDVDAATEAMYLDRERLRADTHRDDLVNRLAELDQTQLWSCAARVRITDEQLRDLTDGLELSAEDTELVAEVEARHQTLEAALEQHLRLRRRTATVAAISMVSAIPVAVLQPAWALPILAIGVLTVLLTLVYRARVEAARRSERNALADAGADSYFGFVVQRVDDMFSGREERKRLVAISEDHRNAAVRWTRMAGEVSVDWALAHHRQIESAAHLRRQLRSLTQVSTTAPELDEGTADLAHAVQAHMAHLRRLGPRHQSFPLILDDPFSGLEASMRLSLLEVLARAAGAPQVILLTEQDDVAGWARLEALTSEVALVEPTTSQPTQSSNHLAV